MNIIFEVIDKSGRNIYLTKERLTHILKHPEMHNLLNEIIQVLKQPIKIIDYKTEENIKYYYGYFKHRKSSSKYLRVIVKYLNGKGFVITSYFVQQIK